MMRPLFAAFVVNLLAFPVVAASHCKPDEVTYFSCKIRNSANVVSLCGSPLGTDATSFLKQGWLQYRFGKPKGGSLFIYPTVKPASVRHFKSEHHSFLDEGNARGYNDRVWFKNREAEYGVIVDQGSQYFYGVWVNVSEKLPCEPKQIDFGSPSGDGFNSLVRHLSPVE